MAVEVRSSSRFRSMLIAAGVLVAGLIVIFGIKYFMVRSESSSAPAVESHEDANASEKK